MFNLSFQHDKFDESYEQTNGVDFYTKNITVDGNACRLQVWDTSGSEKFMPLLPEYLKEAHGVVITYDVTS